MWLKVENGIKDTAIIIPDNGMIKKKPARFNVIDIGF